MCLQEPALAYLIDRRRCHGFQLAAVFLVVPHPLYLPVGPGTVRESNGRIARVQLTVA